MSENITNRPDAQVRFIEAMAIAQDEVFAIAKAHGFWPPEGRNKGEMIALMHSELSEMLEEVRKPTEPTGLLAGFTGEEIEAADVLIRLLDYCAGHGLRLAEATISKMAYNEQRAFKHGKHF